MYNILSSTNNISPSDLFFGAQDLHHKLHNVHVWGYPVYVLNPTLQPGNKIPRWEPPSKWVFFVDLLMMEY